MSKKNRLMVYNKLVAEDRLSQDDGALEREFGKPKPVVEKKEEPKAKKK